MHDSQNDGIIYNHNEPFIIRKTIQDTVTVSLLYVNDVKLLIGNITIRRKTKDILTKLSGKQKI